MKALIYKRAWRLSGIDDNDAEAEAEAEAEMDEKRREMRDETRALLVRELRWLRRGALPAQLVLLHRSCCQRTIGREGILLPIKIQIIL